MGKSAHTHISAYISINCHRKRAQEVGNIGDNLWGVRLQTIGHMEERKSSLPFGYECNDPHEQKVNSNFKMFKP